MTLYVAKDRSVKETFKVLKSVYAPYTLKRVLYYSLCITAFLLFVIGFWYGLIYAVVSTMS